MILLSVICRLRHPILPGWRATSSPARVRSTISSLSISARLAIMWKKNRPGRGSGVDRGCRSSELNSLFLELADEIHKLLNASPQPIQFPNLKGDPGVPDVLCRWMS